MNNKLANQYIRKALDYARRLTVLADEGEGASRDDGCAVLYGIVRDCAYKIRNSAERERDVHRLSGRWDENGSRVVTDSGPSESGVSL